jgi:hypothetical protein
MKQHLKNTPGTGIIPGGSKGQNAAAIRIYGYVKKFL